MILRPPRSTRTYTLFPYTTLSRSHLTDEDRTIAMSRLATLIAPEGILIVSLRHGPGAIERRVFPVSPDMTVEVAKACDLRLIRRREANSVQAANHAIGVSWTWLGLQKVC